MSEEKREYKMEKFNGGNFSIWKMRMRAILVKDKCLAAITEKPEKITEDKWEEMDANATANLHLGLGDEILSSIEEKKTVKEIWDYLTNIYEAKSLHNRIFLKRRLYTLRMSEFLTVTEHVNTLNSLLSQLNNMDCVIGTSERAEILFQSLLNSYDQLIINLTANLHMENLNFDNIVAAIIDEKKRCMNKEDLHSK